MNKVSSFGLILLVIFTWTPPSFAKEKEYSVDQSHSTVDFSFKSTLHPVAGEVHAFSGRIIADLDKNIVLKSGKFEFDVNSMDTHEPKRDENMRTMLHASDYSSVVFEIENAEFVQNGTAVIHGQLTICDVKVPLDILSKVVRVDDGLVLSGEVPLSLKRFSLKPPSVALLIRVFDTVKVNFSVSLMEKI